MIPLFGYWIALERAVYEREVKRESFFETLRRRARFEAELEAGFCVPPAPRETIRIRWPVRGLSEGIATIDDTS